MDKIYLKARAKVNLTLNILEKRQDNYHNLESIFQKINLYDEMWIEKIPEKVFKLDSNIEGVKIEENIIYKAYNKIKEKYELSTGVHVTLNKKIPMQAGLAGGSTDCASFIIGMKRLFKLNISDEERNSIAVSLGADVIPCFSNGVIRATGIGDNISEIYTDFNYYMIIIKAKFLGNTKEMYEKLDNMQYELINNNLKMEEALKNKNLYQVSKLLQNDFEEVLKENFEFLKVREALKRQGALNVLLAGSGSCVFAIFDSKDRAKNAYNNLKKEFETYICMSYNRKNKI